MRLRHAMFRVETPVVDVMVGQYWHLFGWHGELPPRTRPRSRACPESSTRERPRCASPRRFTPARHESRSRSPPYAHRRAPSCPRARPAFATRSSRGKACTRPGRDRHLARRRSRSRSPATTEPSRFPEVGGARPDGDGAANRRLGGGGRLHPILPARQSKRDNALSLLGQAVYGNGIADLYTGMHDGHALPVHPEHDGRPGLRGVADQHRQRPRHLRHHARRLRAPPHPVDVAARGLEYYLPGLGGKVWILRQLRARRVKQLVAVRAREQRAAGIRRPTSSRRTSPRCATARTGGTRTSSSTRSRRCAVGLEFATFYDHYVDGFTAQNYRAQASGFFIF